MLWFPSFCDNGWTLFLISFGRPTFRLPFDDCFVLPRFHLLRFSIGFSPSCTPRLVPCIYRKPALQGGLSSLSPLWLFAVPTLPFPLPVPRSSASVSLSREGSQNRPRLSVEPLSSSPRSRPPGLRPNLGTSHILNSPISLALQCVLPLLQELIAFFLTPLLLAEDSFSKIRLSRSSVLTRSELHK